MLVSLSIKNYALIENLEVDFQNELSIITGETGAGKSILLGGLSLVLGKRADISLVNNKDKKCIIEAIFDIENYDLTSFFSLNDLDFEPLSNVRREILPNGKSRAFINDTPVKLSVLSEFSNKLIDIHSQHETLQLSDENFQFHIIDNLAGNKKKLLKYSSGLKDLKDLQKELELIKLTQQNAKNELDYNIFLFDELEEAKLEKDNVNNLEEELAKLSHVEEIKVSLCEVVEMANEDQLGLKNLMQKMKSSLARISSYASTYANLYERMNSLFIEFDDLVDESERENEDLEYNADEMEIINQRLKLLYDLKKKHSVETIKDLIDIRAALELKISEAVDSDENIKIKELEILQLKNKLLALGKEIHVERSKMVPVFTDKLEHILRSLEMKNTRVKINLQKGNELLFNGIDSLEFLLSSNKGASFENLKKVASGGELSRIMLAVKNILSSYTKLPAIIFDEIDTGVSGEVSNRIASIMREMSRTMQVISITHLPQIAAKGNHHFKVYKEEIDGKIVSNIKLLNEEERIVELAEMLGGKDLSESAIAHAKQLLN